MLEMHFANTALLKFHEEDLLINILTQQIWLLTFRRDNEEYEDLIKKAAVLLNNASLWVKRGFDNKRKFSADSAKAKYIFRKI